MTLLWIVETEHGGAAAVAVTDYYGAGEHEGESSRGAENERESDCSAQRSAE